MTRGRAPAIAIGAAAVALVISAIAVVVVAGRGDSALTPAAETTRISASQLARLQHDARFVEIAGRPTGVTVRDDALRLALGLDPEDVITHLGGVPITSARDLRMTVAGAKYIYAEVLRGGTPITVRWEVVGELRVERDPPAPIDPFVASVEKLDDLRYVVPRSTLERVLANPGDFARAVRILHAADGVRLHTIRPDSLVAALGFETGDTVRAINGHPLAGASNAVDVLAKIRDAKEVAFDITRRGKYELISVVIR